MSGIRTKALFTALMSAALLAGCGEAEAAQTIISPSPAASSQIAEAASSALATEDRAGNAITLPAQMERIVSMAPSTTRVLIDLGQADKIVGIDTNSASYADELADDLPQFDMMEPDNEAIAELNPDLVFTSGMSNVGGSDVFKSLKDMGICVADIPSSTSFAGIEEDIQFIGDCIGASDEAKALADNMRQSVDSLKAVGDSIPENEKKTVLFEISIPTSDYPTIYTAGSGTYLDEMITTIGAVNVCADQGSWVSLSEEDAIALNPDVIITNVNYVDDPIGTILKEEGWENVNAVVNQQVYYVDADASNQPNQHVLDAAIAMAKDIYPEWYESFEDPLAELDAPYNSPAD